MPCYHPNQAWSTKTETKTIISFGKEPPHWHSTPLSLPCGRCIGCNMAQAKAWALRCQLELQLHRAALFTTLTYDQKHLPITLAKRHLQLFLKRLRRSVARSSTNRTLRFFASGEYGETNGRPHYHAILYGLAPDEHQLVNDAWGLGLTKTVPVTPAAISYVAGYTSKKIGWKDATKHERVDPDTGELYTWQPPFIQMSRRPGIGGHARQWQQSWRLYAIMNGTKMPVPRFLHESWKASATLEQQEELHNEKIQYHESRDNSPERRHAAEAIALARQALSADKRKL